MQKLLFLPFLIQAICIFFDEGYFHLKRGLPKFERIGHPLDTLTVIACFALAAFSSYTEFTFYSLIFLSLFSCFFVTKDEFVHFKYCESKEMWLHAVLFINHPILLFSMLILWLHQNKIITWFPFDAIFIHQFLILQLGLSLLFFSYQVIYWNFIFKEKKGADETNQ